MDTISSAAADHIPVELNVDVQDQSRISATLTGLPPGTNYARKIEWYRGTRLLKTVDIVAGAPVTSCECIYDRLDPGSTYAIAVKIYGQALLATRSVAVTTPVETGTLHLIAKSTYVTAEVTGMFAEPGYDRTVEFYYKRTSESAYVRFDDVRTQRSAAKTTITGLVPKTEYDVKAVIRSDKTVFKTLTGSVTTEADRAVIPTANIQSVTQVPGENKCTITWNVDREMTGTVYTAQGKTADASEWIDLISLARVTSPMIVDAPGMNVDAVFRIAAANEDLQEGLVNHSEEYQLHIQGDFAWDVEKVQAQAVVITAEEWNRLRDHAIAKNDGKGIIVRLEKAEAGAFITADMYNAMKEAISNIADVGVRDKQCGDVISAADIDALRIAVNA